MFYGLIDLNSNQNLEVNKMLEKDILGTIGETPMVELNRFVGKEDATVIAKLESFNPGGSVKDRIALAMIEAYERDGLLKSGDTIIEPTSGNTGIGIAIVAAVKGYDVVFTMPESFSLERRMMLELFGAHLVLTEAAKGMPGTIEKAEELVDKHGYVMLQQFNNLANPEVHALTTGVEIINDLREGGLTLDYFVSGVGTGGTITGAGSTLKAEYPNVKLIAVEPEKSPVLSGGEKGPHAIEGIGAGFVPYVYNASLVDEVRTVSEDNAFETARRLAKEEGIFAGKSSGAAAYVAAQLAKEVGKNNTIVVVLPDTGERYLSTGLFGE